LSLDTTHRSQTTVGIVGTGDIALSLHLPVLLSMADVRVAWVSDAAEARARDVSRACGVPYAPLPADPRELPTCDVVLLAIPYGARPPYYEALSARGSAVLAEKPFARSVPEHERVCAMFPDYALGCSFQRRAWGPTSVARELMEKRALGELKSAAMGFGQPGLIPTGKYYSNMSLAGGGPLLESAVHGVDAILFCTGAQDVALDGGRMITEGGFDLDTEADLRIVDGEGRSVPFHVVVSCLRETSRMLELSFDGATVAFDFSKETAEIVTADGKTHYSLRPQGVGTYATTADAACYLTWRAFLDGVRNHSPNWTAAASSILTSKALGLLYSCGETSGREG
jgi:predicted dehydrogenase